ncbi:MAG: hypothetical protein FWH27_12875 [Planctomycetaceae bacterium]|nr:hypothetical protein [Planctomycetaceae bacterium]
MISEKIIPDHDCDLPDIDVTEALTPRHGSDVSYQPKWEQSDYYPNQPSRHKTSKSTEIKNHRRHDDVPPVVIPISQVGTQTTSRKGVFSPGKSRKPTHVNQLNQQNDYPDGSAVDLSMLPWGLFSQYENETFVNLASNASNLSLFIGWGAIASGIVIFVRSFFVSSMIWLNYGLPVLALGAACLFLGIILSILSEKMQHINDLKQSLTAHRILNPTKREPETSVRQQKYIEVEDVYDRLLKLRSDIDELIDEWATPAQ